MDRQGPIWRVMRYLPMVEGLFTLIAGQPTMLAESPQSEEPVQPDEDTQIPSLIPADQPLPSPRDQPSPLQRRPPSRHTRGEHAQPASKTHNGNKVKKNRDKAATKQQSKITTSNSIRCEQLLSQNPTNLETPFRIGVPKMGRHLEEDYDILHKNPRVNPPPITCGRPQTQKPLSFEEMLKMLHDATDQDTAPFPLLRLPPELRHRVFQCALIRETVHPYTYRLHHHGEAPCVGLLRTCRQVYKEAVTLVYEENRFAFVSPTLLVRFARARQLFKQSDLIRTILLAPNSEDMPLPERLPNAEFNYSQVIRAHHDRFMELRQQWRNLQVRSMGFDEGGLADLFPSLGIVRMDLSRSGCSRCGIRMHELAGHAIAMSVCSRAPRIHMIWWENVSDPASYKWRTMNNTWRSHKDIASAIQGIMKILILATQPRTRKGIFFHHYRGQANVRDLGFPPIPEIPAMLASL